MQILTDCDIFKYKPSKESVFYLISSTYQLILVSFFNAPKDDFYLGIQILQFHVSGHQDLNSHN